MKTNTKPTPPNTPPRYICMPDKVAADIYTFINYERLTEEFGKEGLSIKENKNFYEQSVLRFLSEIFKEKTEPEIKALINVLYDHLVV